MSGERAGFAAIWAEILGAERTLGLEPGVREAWHRGRERYAVWLLRVREEAALARMAEVGEAIGARLGARFRPQPASEAHITAFVAGFPSSAPSVDDDVDYVALEEQAARVAGRLGGPLRLALGGANAFLSCPFLEVHDPDGGLAALREALAAPTREIRFAPYHPHLTLGLLPESVPAAALTEALLPYREAPELQLGFDALELASFDPRVPGAPLETLRRVVL